MAEHDDDLDANYESFLAMLDKFTPHDAAQRLRRFRTPEDMVKAILERHEWEVLRIRRLEEPRTVVFGNRMTWYTGPRPDDVNWPRVAKMLSDRGWTGENLTGLDDASSRIVALLDHPSTSSFRTYGLVVGYVQSGKTTNFTAVMAKAADRGYRLFIVLSGVHNALRRQTQLRVDSDLVAHNVARWHPGTSPDSDFKMRAGAAAMVAAKNQHVLLVVKKNATVLRRLRNWLDSAREQLMTCPTLIIDDEADQSTVATKTINPLLADIMLRLPKVAYVGYTATPFANLLIDPARENDFYPRHFVVNLPRPDGYYGPEVLFGRDLLDSEDPEDLPGGFDMIREVPADEVDALRPPTQGAGGFRPAVTDSLATAIEYFMLATAARRARGTGNRHSTMLLHTTVQTPVHFDFRDEVEAFRATLSRDISAGAPTRLDALRRLWAEEARRVPAMEFRENAVGFDELQPYLADVVAETRVIVDNSRSRDRLDYETDTPVTAIAIGGNTLSRGLTLEGLVVSFFVRAVSYYDTLLQMGRWFGYREGYADLPRIWLTAELSEWFRHLATVEAEMRRDIDRYMVEDATPQTFAVRLRAHPKLAITTAAKMTDAVKAHAAYGGVLVETRYFNVHAEATEWLAANAAAAKDLVSRARGSGAALRTLGDDRAYVEDVNYEDVLRFVNAYNFHEKSLDCRPRQLIDYIERRVASGALTTWSVGIVGSGRAGAENYRFSDDLSVGKVTRARLPSPDDAADIKTLTSRRDEMIDLPQEALPQAADRPTILDLRFVHRPNRGLLLLYPIDPVSRTTTTGRIPLNAPYEVVMGAAFVFPKPVGDDSEITYYSADLSNLPVEQEDLSALEDEDDA